MSAGTIVSRVTGVIRLAVLAATLGIAETRLTDTYNLANTAPNLIYELVLGGVITSVFVPLFVELIEKETKERAWEVISGILNVTLAVLAVIAVIGVLAAPFIAGFYSGRLEGEDALLQQEVITFLLRLLIPQVVFYGLYFVLAGVLNSYKRFGAPMFTPIVNNLVLIGVLLVFRELYGAVSLATVSRSQLLLIGLGTTISVAPMGLALVPYIRKLGRYKLTFSLDHPSIGKLMRLAPFVVGMVVANQLGYLVIQWLANEQPGGYTAFISAFTFFLLPVGLFVWSLNSAMLPQLSSAAINEDWDAFRSRFSLGIRATVFLMVPAVVGYLILARSIVRVLLEHGVVTEASTDLVAAVLFFLSLGLLQFSLFQLITRAFYSIQDTKTPFFINALVVALNVGINVPMFMWLGVKGLGVGQAVAYTVGLVLQWRSLARRVGGLNTGVVIRAGMKVVVAAAAMGGVVWVSWAALRGALDPMTPLVEGAALLVPVTAGVITFVAAAHLLHVQEVGYLRDLFRRRAPQ